MRISTVAALMIITTVLLSACTQEQSAALDDRSNYYYGKNGGSMMARAGTFQAAPVDSVSTGAPSISFSNNSAPSSVGYVPFGKPTPAPASTTSAAPVMQQAAQPTSFATAGAWQWPVNGGRLTSRFGSQGAGIANEGITIAAPDGAAIHAVSAGEVAYVGENVRDYGTMVILRHPNGELTSYAHAKQITVLKGDKVAAGQTIGYVGQTGNVSSPQLHFALREGDHAVDPLSKLPSQMASR